MTNDKELLELAAKAVGLKGEYFDETSGGGAGMREHELFYPNWNPLADDGDALRLAVTLKLSPIMRGENAVLCVSTDFFEDAGDDPYAATRRAIVRAAAEIGRNMK